MSSFSHTLYNLDRSGTHQTCISYTARGHVVPNFSAEKLLFVPRFYMPDFILMFDVAPLFVVLVIPCADSKHTLYLGRWRPIS